MANRTGHFLSAGERQRLLRLLESNDDLLDDTEDTVPNMGCQICLKDDAHDSLILCDGCNDAYHIYCLNPPLRSVPEDDWYCEKCSVKMNNFEKDGLDELVCALPKCFSSRFGEICWAHGGFGFGWWPCCIYDPRLTDGGARRQARKNLGKKHLVYFFECHEAPFAVLPDNKMTPWEEGLAFNYHLGRTAKASGKQRGIKFQQALQAAIIEHGKPFVSRLLMNHDPAQPQLLPVPPNLRLKLQPTTPPQLDEDKIPAPSDGNWLQSPSKTCTLSKEGWHSGMFLTEENRNKLIEDLQQDSSEEVKGGEGVESGCRVCFRDDDHESLMLCEGCNDAYHIYCLDPPLSSVPDDDWFCDKCKVKLEHFENDGLDELVLTLPKSFLSRFGEICWAQGGLGFGWWPCCIYDPRLTEGGARRQARKNLGKKHLIYFFECHEAPFAVLPNNKITEWEMGLACNYHLGRTARASGRQRNFKFQHALQAAILEGGKPIDRRLGLNHDPAQPQLLPIPRNILGKNKRSSPSPGSTAQTPEQPSEALAMVTDEAELPTSSKRPRSHKASSEVSGLVENQMSSKQPVNTSPADKSWLSRSDRHGELFCKVLKKDILSSGSSDTANVVNIGFVQVASGVQSTFADVRNAIINDLVPDFVSPNTVWNFDVDTLGNVSLNQESSLGPLLPFLQKVSDFSCGEGTVRSPLRVTIVEQQHV